MNSALWATLTLQETGSAHDSMNSALWATLTLQETGSAHDSMNSALWATLTLQETGSAHDSMNSALWATLTLQETGSAHDSMNSALWATLTLQETGSAHDSMNSALWATLTLQETGSAHDSMNRPKIEFIFEVNITRKCHNHRSQTSPWHHEEESPEHKVRKKAKIRNPYNQIPNLTQDTIWESDKNTRKHHMHESQVVSPFPAGDHKAARYRQDSLTGNTNYKKRSTKEAPLVTVSKKLTRGLKHV